MSSARLARTPPRTSSGISVTTWIIIFFIILVIILIIVYFVVIRASTTTSAPLPPGFELPAGTVISTPDPFGRPVNVPTNPPVQPTSPTSVLVFFAQPIGIRSSSFGQPLTICGSAGNGCGPLVTLDATNLSVIAWTLVPASNPTSTANNPVKIGDAVFIRNIERGAFISDCRSSVTAFGVAAAIQTNPVSFTITAADSGGARVGDGLSTQMRIRFITTITGVHALRPGLAAGACGTGVAVSPTAGMTFPSDVFTIQQAM